MKLERELMRGTGPTAVLQLLSTGEMYGYELVEQLARQSGNVLAMGQSTLYPMLYNLEAKGLVKGEDRTASNGRRRRYYHLTAKGKKKLITDKEQWTAVNDALTKLGVINPAGIANLGAI
ncbi:MAG: helix-turn-helix transcriptional regulator [Planctomycetota bacterium]